MFFICTPALPAIAVVMLFAPLRYRRLASVTHKLPYRAIEDRRHQGFADS
jgi:hypothetical protein